MFDAIFTPQALLDELGDTAWLQAMLDAERALAHAEAAIGVIPATAAAAIATVCRAELYDAAQIAREGHATGTPAEPLVRALRAQAGGEAAGFAHHGATSQDIVDTAAVLVARRALALVEADVARACAACAALVEAHRDTPMVARTLLQHALPTTFGCKAAGWLTALLDAERLVASASAELAAQLGGAAGTLAALGDNGPAVAARYAQELGLPAADLPWHASRVRIAALGSALAILAGVLAKIALDIALLAQTEVGEVAEPAGGGRGGSSTMPHKRNPVGSALTRACALRAQAYAGLLTAGLAGEHERAAGAWHAEWDGVAGVLGAAGGAASQMAEVLAGLEVDPARMRANLDLTHGLLLSERLVFLLAEVVGQEAARRVVGEAGKRATATGSSLHDELARDERVPLSAAELTAAFDPETYTGAAGVLADRALARYRHERPA